MPTLRPIPPPIDPPQRWARVELPNYRHVPGLTPHPVNHPEGHSYRGPDAPEPPGDPSMARLPTGWESCHPYLYGVDLFNYRYFWEAHEAWEEVWHAVGHRSVTGHFIQGLIQISAAHLKRHMRVPRGVTRLVARAEIHLDVVPASQTAFYMGVDLTAWRSQVAEHLSERGGRFPLLVPDPGAVAL